MIIGSQEDYKKWIDGLFNEELERRGVVREELPEPTRQALDRITTRLAESIIPIDHGAQFAGFLSILGHRKAFAK